MSTKYQRAPRSEIFEHLKSLVGLEAVQTAIQVADLSRAGKVDAAMMNLKTYDATLGGIGMHSIIDKQPLGVYLALFYFYKSLLQSNPEDLSRYMIQSACGYLEELLKYKVRLWPWEENKVDGLPLGALIKKASKHLPIDLVDEIAWLSRKVYNFAKHEYNLDDEFGDEQPEHYFLLEEAIAVYLIVRNLGLRLEKVIGKSPEQLGLSW
jgi:hypothetical protein